MAGVARTGARLELCYGRQEGRGQTQPLTLDVLSGKGRYGYLYQTGAETSLRADHQRMKEAKTTAQRCVWLTLDDCAATCWQRCSDQIRSDQLSMKDRKPEGRKIGSYVTVRRWTRAGPAPESADCTEVCPKKAPLTATVGRLGWLTPVGSITEVLYFLCSSATLYRTTTRSGRVR